MKTYSARRKVEKEHIDEGNHANWRAQLAIAEEVHFAFREGLGFGLDELQTKGLFLVMRNVKDVEYLRQLRLGDILNIQMMMWVYTRCRLGFHCTFEKQGDEKVATEMLWEMTLISEETERPLKIPDWMANAIGREIPEVLQKKLASAK